MQDIVGENRSRFATTNILKAKNLKTTCLFNAINNKENLTEALRAFMATSSGNPKEMRVWTLASSTACSEARESFDMGSFISASQNRSFSCYYYNFLCTGLQADYHDIKMNHGSIPTWIIHVWEEPIHCFLNSCVWCVNGSFLTMKVIEPHASKLGHNIFTGNRWSRLCFVVNRSWNKCEVKDKTEKREIMKRNSNLLQVAALPQAAHPCCAYVRYQLYLARLYKHLKEK